MGYNMKRKYEKHNEEGQSRYQLSIEQALVNQIQEIERLLDVDDRRPMPIDLHALSHIMRKYIDSFGRIDSSAGMYKILSVLELLLLLERKNDRLISGTLDPFLLLILLKRVSNKRQGDFSAYALAIFRNLYEKGLLYYPPGLFQKFFTFEASGTSFFEPRYFPVDFSRRQDYLHDLLYLIENGVFVCESPETVMTIRDALGSLTAQDMDVAANTGISTVAFDASDDASEYSLADEMLLASSVEPPLLTITPLLIGLEPIEPSFVSEEIDGSDSEQDEEIATSFAGVSASTKRSVRARNISTITQAFKEGNIDALMEILDGLGCSTPLITSVSKKKRASVSPVPACVVIPLDSPQTSLISSQSFFSSPNLKAVDIVCEWMATWLKAASRNEFIAIIKADRSVFFERILRVFSHNRAQFYGRLGQSEGLSLVIQHMPIDSLPRFMSCLSRLNIKTSKDTTMFVSDCLHQRKRNNPAEADIIQPLYDTLYSEAIVYHTNKRAGVRKQTHHAVVNELRRQKQRHDEIDHRTSHHP